MRKSNHKIAIIGLGYVGLPLAVEFAKKYPVIGFDINIKRVEELSMCKDQTLEVPSEALKKVLFTSKDRVSDNEIGLITSSDLKDISSVNIFIVTVPTPIDVHKKPNLKPKRKTRRWYGELKEWHKNQAKWKFAEEYCKNNDMEFQILTEDNLGY